MKRRVLITGGPTRAYLDDVRYLSNLSTGATAFELCRQLAKKGFSVTAIIGPTVLPFKKLPIDYVPVETNQEMFREVIRVCRRIRPEVAIFSAAVLDFVPSHRKRGKTSSQQKRWTIQLKPFPKIIDEVGKRFPKIRRVGFKLESKRLSPPKRDLLAQKTFREKRLALLILNFLNDVTPHSHIAYLYRPGSESKTLFSKKEIAGAIVSRLFNLDGVGTDPAAV